MSCLPAGTLSGAPKIRAMEIIDSLEPNRRGLYGGAICYMDFRGNLDSCIAIRTMLIKDGVGYVQAGGGIVADSDPQMEFEETKHKARALMRAVDAAAGI
jgi:anthranilate synthase component 1